MRKLLVHSSLAAVIAAALVTVTSVTVRAHALGPLTNQQLALARAGTAQYHDLATALADGYIPMGFNPEEGVYEFVNFPLVDCTFDPAHPEGLSFEASGKGMRLVGVEYTMPYACTAAGVPPQGFAGDDDIWGQERDLPIWRLSVRIWEGSAAGPFGSDEDGGGH